MSKMRWSRPRDDGSPGPVLPRAPGSSRYRLAALGTAALLAAVAAAAGAGAGTAAAATATGPYVSATVSLGGYSGPQAVAVDPVTGIVWVAEADGYVQAILGAKVVGSIFVSGNPAGIAVDQETNMVYVAENNLGVVDVIDGNTDKEVDTIGLLGYGAGPVAVDPNTDTVYVVDGSGEVGVIDGATNVLTDNIVVGQNDSPNSWGIAVDPDTDTIYVANSDDPNSGQVQTIDGATNTAGSDVNYFGPHPWQVAVDPVTGTVFATLQSSYEVGVDIDGSASPYAYLGFNAGTEVSPLWTDVAVNPESDTVYVTDPSQGELYIVGDGAGPAITNATSPNAPADEVVLPIAGHPESVAVNPDTGVAYVLDPINGILTEVSTGEVTVDRIPAQFYTAGTSVSVPIVAADVVYGRTLDYAATGLPPGLSINSSTGVISGTLPAGDGGIAGTATVTVTDENTLGGSMSFPWTINP